MTELGIIAASILTGVAEADHFMKCPCCGEWFDLRDLDQLLAHVHDAEIEICEGPSPYPACGCSSADLTTGADEKADQEVRRKTLPGVSRNWLSPCEAAGETGAADICGSLCEMRR
jgi:hypothetical protein